MELFSRAGGHSSSLPRDRKTHSEERDNHLGHFHPAGFDRSVSPVPLARRTHTLQLPVGPSGSFRSSTPVASPHHHHHPFSAASSTPNVAASRFARGKSPNLSIATTATSTTTTNNGGGGGQGAQQQQGVFRHYGSSLSLSNGSSTSDLVSRTLRPPSPTTLRKSSVPGKPKYSSSAKVAGGNGSSGTGSKPSLPSLDSVQLESPRLADYLEKPRLVSLSRDTIRKLSHHHQAGSAAGSPSPHHARRMDAAAGSSGYRNLRLGNFLENGEVNEDELIPERLRQYYLDTYLNVCNTCESSTHLDPSCPIQKGLQRGH